MEKKGPALKSIERVSVTCPQCRSNTGWHNNPYRPFCSERCRLIDLGCWVEETYRMPGETVESEQQNSFLGDEETF